MKTKAPRRSLNRVSLAESELMASHMQNLIANKVGVLFLFSGAEFQGFSPKNFLYLIVGIQTAETKIPGNGLDTNQLIIVIKLIGNL